MKEGFTSKEVDVSAQTVWSSSECEDIHAQAGLLDKWNQSYSQLSSGAFRGGVSMLGLPGMHLFVEKMNQSVYQSGQIAGMRLGFGIAARASGNCSMCGERAQASDLIVFSGAGGFEFISPRDFIFLGVELDVAELTSDAVELAQALESRLHARRKVIRLDPCQADGLARLFRSMFQSGGPGGGSMPSQNHLKAMQRQFLGSVIDDIDTTSARDPRGQPGGSHWAIISQIRESVIDNPDCPLTVAELTLQLNLSRRTIQNAVANTLDMSPLTFLRALRLSEVRREIATAASVTETATRWGFWHFGYFARDYRAMFGELPSETLTRARGAARQRNGRTAPGAAARPR